MPALVSGGIAALGLGGAMAAAPSGYSIPGYGPKKATFQPLLLQFLQAGGDPSQLSVTKAGKGKWKLPDGTIVSRAETVKLGGQRYAIAGPAVQGIFDSTFEANAEKSIAQKQRMYDDLFGADGPQFLKDMLTDRPAQVREAFAPAYQDLLRGALGAAAPGGTLTTEAIQRQMAAPVALQSEQFFQGVRDSVNAAKLGITGVPGFGAGFPFDPTNMGGPQQSEYLQQLGLGAAGLQQQGQLASAQSGFQADLFKAGLFGGAGTGFAGSYLDAFGGG